MEPDDLAETLAWCLRQSNPFHAFNEVVLNRVDRSITLHDGMHPGSYWSAQRDICRAMVDPVVTTIAVPAGHSVGKSYLAAGLIIGWLALYPDSMSISTSPSNAQLEGVLWKEIRRAFGGSAVAPYGRITSDPQKLDFGDGWHALGFSTNKPERMQGHHTRGPVLNLVDEASGVEDPDIWATLKSLKPRKTVLFSNPLRLDGPFYEACQRAETDPTVRLIRIPATDSPDAEQEHSERGLADAAWLREMANDYGVGTLVWKVRVDAQFPGSAEDAVILASWLDLAEKAIAFHGGHRRIAIDLGAGQGGDSSVILVRDDNAILDIEHSNRWSLEKTAERAAAKAARWNVHPGRVSWDAESIGTDFNNRLEAAGIKGARPYRGGNPGDGRFTNLRTYTAWMVRQRLDPNFMAKQNGLYVPQVPFAIPREFMLLLRKELQGLRYTLDPAGRIALEEKKAFAKRLKKSPDFADAFQQSFGFPNT